MPGPADSDRRSAFPAGCGGVRRTLPRRTESPGTGQLPHLGPSGYPDDESRATAYAARRIAQLLSASGVIVRLSEKWNTTGSLLFRVLLEKGGPVQHQCVA